MTAHDSTHPKWWFGSFHGANHDAYSDPQPFACIVHPLRAFFLEPGSW